jgi:hypothetical protein
MMRFVWPFNSTGLIMRGKREDVLCCLSIKGVERADGSRDNHVCLWMTRDRKPVEKESPCRTTP